MKIILNSFGICLLLTGVIQTAVINVPSEHGTIQAGINAAVNGDTVLVGPGEYVENINIKGKNIVVGSLLLITGDTSYISQTVINGNKQTTVVMFKNGEDNTSVLSGFLITNGQVNVGTSYSLPDDCIGGGITCINNSNPSLTHLKIRGNTNDLFGGGIYIRGSKPKIENVIVNGNTAERGGGIYCDIGSNPVLKNMTIMDNIASYHGGGVGCSEAELELMNVIITENKAHYGGGIDCGSSTLHLENVTITKNTAFIRGGGIGGWRDNLIFNSVNRCNIFLNNSGIGSDICLDESPTVSVIVDTFTVMNPTNYHASPVNNFTFNILQAKIDPVDHDLYVSPVGNDFNNGLSADEPVRTISFATLKIIADPRNPRTIYLAEGIYKPSSGEHFPLNMVDYVSLVGSSPENVILDAEGKSNVLCFDSDQRIAIENLTITGGYTFDGGAIYCSYSDPILRNIMITKNTSSHGGGIYCKYSSPTLINVTIFENTASWGGGGIFCEYKSSPILKNVTMSRNSAKYWGGAAYSGTNANPHLVNTILWNNLPHQIRLLNGDVTIEYSDIEGGKEQINYDDSDWFDPDSVNWLEGNIDANPLFCDPEDGIYTLAENSPCIGTGKNGTNMGAQNVGCDSIFIKENPTTFYVSVTGSNDLGDGTYDNPFSTIQYAIDFVTSGDSILVYPGIYFENIHFYKKDIVLASLFMTTGDTSYISDTVIDGDSSGSVIFINNGDSTSVLCGFTITHGKADEGGGIYCHNSNPTLSNIRVVGNTAHSGGGISASNSKFKLIHSVIANNHSTVFGGGISIDGSSPLLTNVMIKGNIAEGSGGGCVFSSSNPLLKNVTIKENVAYYNGGGISLQFSSAIFDTLERCNIYMNHAGRGSDIDFYNFDKDNADIIVYADTFTVKNPTDFHVYRIDKFNILHGKLNQSNSDLYVSPLGNNDNSGKSFSEPLQTLSYALSKIEADSINPCTIYISEGVYSPRKNGEHFPLNMVDYVSLKGENSDNVILNAEGLSGLLSFDSDMGVDVEDLTITGGFRFEGGGISCDNSSPNLIKVAIIDNKAMASGGGMVCRENSYPNLENVTISGNEAGFGGGIAFFGSFANLLNTILWNNSPDEIYFHGQEYPKSCVEISFTDVMDSTNRIIQNNNGDVYWLEGNLNSDPFFCNSDSGNYSIAENSPCIGTGKNGENMGALCIGCSNMDIENEHVGLPIKFVLHQNYPNPFNPTTTISYELPKPSFVRLSVYDINGRLVETLVNEMKNAGYYSVEWNVEKVSSGIYFYQINAGDFTSTGKCLLLK